MSTKDEILKPLKELRHLIEVRIDVEIKRRERLKKRKMKDIDEMVSDSMSYQRSLELMHNSLTEDITLLER